MIDKLKMFDLDTDPHTAPTKKRVDFKIFDIYYGNKPNDTDGDVGILDTWVYSHVYEANPQNVQLWEPVKFPGDPEETSAGRFQRIM